MRGATVAGSAGPGFHTWPSGHIPQDTAPNPLLRIRSSAKKTFGEAFGAATGVSDPRLQKIRIRNNGAGGDAATVDGVAGPGFHTWPSGHIPQDNGSETAFSHPAPWQKDVRRGVRRGDRGQRPTATNDPDTKQLRRRQSRHCSWGRWPRFSQLALRPHPSRHGSESAFSHPALCQKDVRRRVRRVAPPRS